MLHLPTELIFTILEHAYYKSNGSPDYNLLTSCALVCASWSVPAQILLFSRTSKLQSDTAVLFHAALLSSAKRLPDKPIGHAVRSLDITIINENNFLDTFIQILEACPALYELVLSTCGLHELDQFALARVKHAGQSIRALYLERCGVQSPLLFQLLGIWPRIRFLKIGSEIAAWPWRQKVSHPSRNDTHANPHGSDMTRHPPSRVALYDLALSRTLRPAVLTWLLGSSSTSLRILDLREFPGTVEREIFSVHAPRLRSLRLLHFSLDSAAFLRQCTRLEELVVYNIPVLVPLAPELSQTIEHLSFRNPAHAYRRTLRPILDAIEVLPRLCIVTCDKNSEGLREFVLLKTVCAERGIEVVISEMPIWLYEDPVVVRRFPRRRSVSNFAMMTSSGPSQR